MSEVDYLEEDPVIQNQKYFVLSYFLPKPEDKLNTIIKVRGSYSSTEECKRRIVKLQKTDTYCNMYVCEVGKWGELKTDEELENQEDVDVNYKNESLQEFMKAYRKNRDESEELFNKHKEEKLAKARYDGTKEGQAELASKKEKSFVVEGRISDNKQKVKDLMKDIEELNKQIEEDEYKLKNNYTEEEIENDKKELEEFKKRQAKLVKKE